MRRTVAWLLCSGCLSFSVDTPAPGAPSGATAPASSPSDTLVVAQPLRTLALPLPEAVLDAFRVGDWITAGAGLRAMPIDALVGAQKGDWAFLVAWCAVHGEDPASAADVLPLLDGTTTVPEPYLALVRGELLAATGKPLDALPWFDRVSSGSVIAPRAALKAADALAAVGRTADARAKLEPIAARPDPAEGNAEVLLRLAEGHGIGSPEAYPLLRRIWTFYPGTAPDIAATADLLRYPNQSATWQEHALRGERWMDAQDFAKASAEVEPYAAKAIGDSLDACRLRFVRGRSSYKRNAVSDAAAALVDIGPACVNASIDYGPRGLYLLGTAQYRRKQFDAAAAAYRQLADLYPTHSMADDALTRGGIALIEAGRESDARKWWEEALAEYPDGDTVPEALMRLSFARYLDGDAEDARRIATKLGGLPLAGDQVSVQAGRYWAARWRLYGTASAPSKKSADPAAVADAVAGWKALCEQLPHSFYAILAYSRLVEVAPDVAKDLAVRPDGHDDGHESAPWVVRVGVARDPHLRDGVALMRLGLAGEAMAEWSRADKSALNPDERAWLSELRIVAGDWLAAHDELRKWIGTHPLSTLGPREPQIIRLAYPDRYWTEVKAAVKPTYRFEPRLLHGLVREESNFNRQIVSFAGARGLSQLMPATARQTAGWLGMTITNDELEQPDKNLVLGARYLDAMLKQLAGSPYLALAAYNGGAANVEKWVAEDANPPTDEWVERVPFEETRGYVKRVMGTWQTMRYAFDVADPAFPDLSRYNHHAEPEGG
ncbi:MAG: transglycosylase SLT domain-containing protein [Myxococcota bacterium]